MKERVQQESVCGGGGGQPCNAGRGERPDGAELVKPGMKGERLEWVVATAGRGGEVCLCVRM